MDDVIAGFSLLIISLVIVGYHLQLIPINNKILFAKKRSQLVAKQDASQ